jgi:hypothetical protein
MTVLFYSKCTLLTSRGSEHAFDERTPAAKHLGGEECGRQTFRCELSLDKSAARRFEPRFFQLKKKSIDRDPVGHQLVRVNFENIKIRSKKSKNS